MSIAIARDDDTGRLPDGPRAHPASPDGETSERARPWPEPDLARPGTVLITDDNPGLRQTLNEILSHEGYVVTEAEDGQAALRVLAESPIDVLILDLAMPLMDGIELLHQIDPPPPVVIIYSAFAYFNQNDVQREVGAKVFRFFRKPIHAATLVSAVAEAVTELGED